MSNREKLITELQRISFYWKELSEGRSEEELEKIIAELRQARDTIKGMFPLKIMTSD